LELAHNNIFYSKVGHGPHLCFLHGFCENKTVWNEVISSLKEHYTCISIDLPGFGKSQHLEINSIKQLAVSVTDILVHEKVENSSFFGHSMGGYVALEILNSEPEIVHSIGLAHSTSMADTNLKKENRRKTIDFVSKNGSKEFLNLFAQGLVAESNYNNLKPQITALISATTSNAIVGGLEAMINRADHLETLQNTTKPVLFITGDQDQHIKEETVYHQAAKCKLAQVSVIPNCGHLSMLEDKKKCLIAIRHFLNFIEKSAV
jgi:pimeloyl-ACP methyl ester carboxylesterase